MFKILAFVVLVAVATAASFENIPVAAPGPARAPGAPGPPGPYPGTGPAPSPKSAVIYAPGRVPAWQYDESLVGLYGGRYYGGAGLYDHYNNYPGHYPFYPYGYQRVY